MRAQYVLLSVCIFGLFHTSLDLAALPDGLKQKADKETASKNIKTAINIPPEAEQASNKAREAQKSAIFASRRALKASQKASSPTIQPSSDTIVYSIVTNDQGYRYDGEWLKTSPNYMVYNGYGVLSWPNGNHYEGQFLNGHKNGYGVFTGENSDRYEGEWRNGEINGYGRYIFPTGERYEGEYHNDHRHGYGVMIYPNGERYEGEWRDNEKNGYGVMYNFRGAVEYAGSWPI